MKRLKQYALAGLLAVALVAALTACGAGDVSSEGAGGTAVSTAPTDPEPANVPKKEAGLAEDLINSDYIKDFFVNYVFTVDSLEIVKRQTVEAEYRDTVYVRAVMTDTKGKMKLTGEYTMTYELYNEGWLLETVECTDETVVPLVGSDFTVEKLVGMLDFYSSYHNLENVEIYDHSTNLEEGVDSYSLTAQDVHTYMTEDLDLTISFYFFPYEGGWTLSASWYEVNSSSENWDNLPGEYTINHNHYASYHDPTKLTISYFDGNSYLEYYTGGDEEKRDSTRTISVVEKGTTTEAEYLINQTLSRYTDASIKYRSYQWPIVTNLNWSDVRYIDTMFYYENVGGYHICITPDAIYSISCSGPWYEVDEVNRKIIIEYDLLTRN